MTRSSFNRALRSTKEGYFVKFFVPWCGHCQAMAPAWEELARQMAGKLNVAEVNCDEEKLLCKDLRVSGYPSLMFFRGTERVEYNGLRSVSDLVAFATKAADSTVREIDAAEFETIAKAEEVIFLYFHNENTVQEDFDALDRVALPLIGHAPLYKTTSTILASRFRVTTFPRLVVISDGRPSYYTALSPKDMRDHLKVLAWMRTVWLPVLPELSAANSDEIMQGRTVVLGVLDKSNPDQFELSKKELKAAAVDFLDIRVSEEKTERQEQRDKKEAKIEEATDKGDEKALKAAQSIHIVLPPRKQVGFAWVDGDFWERWLRKTYGISVSEVGERIVINDEDGKKYWDQTATGKPITVDRQLILNTLKVVLDTPGKIKSKSLSNRFLNLFLTAREISLRYPVAIASFVLGLVLVNAWWCTRRSRRARAAGYLAADSSASLPPVGGKFD
ncbi:uncharacterized protein V1510DRAFT_417324 [Dipodascopsis tothii]|uniref:uncharacterized protein n=1 Tax=Dipodascopsis tothii TaxID=44089 RepID=UPI0034CE5730